MRIVRSDQLLLNHQSIWFSSCVYTAIKPLRILFYCLVNGNIWELTSCGEFESHIKKKGGIPDTKPH